MSERFASLGAFVEYCRRVPEPLSDRSSDDDRPHHNEYRWDFGVNYPAALDMAAGKGWPEGAREAKRLLDKIPDVAPRESYASATYLDVSGAYVDVGAFVSGEPENMVEFCEDKRTARFARIIAAGGVSFGIDADVVMARGVTIAAIVDALESRGVRCEVLWCQAIASGWDSWVTLKQASDALNLDVLAYTLAHPTFFRRLGFRAQELATPEEKTRHRLTGCYGMPQRVPQSEVTPDTLVFQSMHLDSNWTERNAAARVQAALERFAAKP